MKSVLVVDDSAPFRKQLRRMLEAGGYQVVAEAATGQGGIAATFASDPALVVVDIGLPDISGFEVAEAVGPYRVVLISGRDPRTFASALEESRVIGFLPKDNLTAQALEAMVGAS
jgi:DNA-binding NarL/FixJ family response regulator